MNHVDAEPGHRWSAYSYGVSDFSVEDPDRICFAWQRDQERIILRAVDAQRIFGDEDDSVRRFGKIRPDYVMAAVADALPPELVYRDGVAHLQVDVGEPIATDAAHLERGEADTVRVEVRRGNGEPYIADVAPVWRPDISEYLGQLHGQTLRDFEVGSTLGVFTNRCYIRVEEWLDEPIDVGNEFELVGREYRVQAGDRIRFTRYFQYTGSRLEKLPASAVREEAVHASDSDYPPTVAEDLAQRLSNWAPQ